MRVSWRIEDVEVEGGWVVGVGGGEGGGGGGVGGCGLRNFLPSLVFVFN